MAYPTSLDSFTNPTATQTLNSPSHSTIETAQNTALAALETKVGITGSAVTASVDYLLTNTSSSNPGHKHTFSSLSDFTVSSSASGDILQYNGTKYINQPSSTIPIKFGGTGADGALSITSGITTIDCANAAVVTKNYTSISITGSGGLAFSNPNTKGTIIILKSQGNVTITTSTNPAIDARSMGAAATNNGNANLSLTVGAVSGATGSSPQAGGAAGTSIFNGTLTANFYRMLIVGCGSGGGNGATGTGNTSGSGGGGGASIITNGTAGSASSSNVTSNGAGGAGALGGGALIIECGGSLSISSTLNAAGANGSNATGTGANGGGGGGGGGTIVLLYNILTSNTGTFTVSAGTGGTATTFGGNGGGGGIGASLVALNTVYA